MAQPAPISVVIPTYNGERFIKAAIASVQRQTVPVSEIIVVDDGSSDATCEIVKHLNVRLIKQSHKGVSAARNTGIRAALNEWIGFLDQDDLWEAEKIASQLSAIRLHPDVGVVSCNLIWFEDESIRGQILEAETIAGEQNDGSIKYLGPARYEVPHNRLLDYPSSLLVRRDLLIRAGMFNESLHQNEDLECFLRLLAQRPLAVVQRALVRRRIHNLNASLNDPAAASESYERILKWLSEYPDKYPTGAAQAHNRALARALVSTGRAVLEEGRRLEARTILGQSMHRAWSGHAAALWCLSFLNPEAFRFLSNIKRRLSRPNAP